MFFERFYKLCSDRGTKPNTLAKVLGISSGTITAWKNGTIPKADKLQIIAAYFDVSTDYLLGKTDMKKPPAGSGEGLDANIKRLMELTSDFSPEEYQRLFEYADLLESARKKKLNE